MWGSNSGNWFDAHSDAVLSRGGPILYMAWAIDGKITTRILQGVRGMVSQSFFFSLIGKTRLNKYAFSFF